MELKEQLYDALMSAFTISELGGLLRGLDVDLSAIADGNKAEQMHDVVNWAERANRTGELIIAAFRERSANEKIEAVFSRYARELGRRRYGGRIMENTPYEAPDPAPRTFEERLRAVEKLANENMLRLRGWGDGASGVEAEVRAMKTQMAVFSSKLDEVLDRIGHFDAHGSYAAQLATILRWAVMAIAVGYAALTAANNYGWF